MEDTKGVSGNGRRGGGQAAEQRPPGPATGRPAHAGRRPRPGPRRCSTEAGLEELLNEALLLTTELSTNAVEHARTELDIEVVADRAGLTVTVSDFAAGPIDSVTARPRNDLTDISEVSERGRGLLLVDHFASRWGTTHQPTGKGVWFRLDRKGSPGTRPAVGPRRTGCTAPPPPASPAPTARPRRAPAR